jgi:hypothetical protein
VHCGNNKVEIEDVPEPTVIDGHVKVKVSRNGICGTDLHEYYDGPIFISPTAPHPLTGKAMPVILGHEFSGTITEIGSGLTTLHEGDRVTIEPIYRCGQCRPCRSGHYNLCNVIGFHGLMAVLRVPGRIGCTSRWGCAGRPRCHCCSRCTGAPRTDWISRPVPDSRFNDLADKHKFVVVFPEQSRSNNGLRCWNWFRSAHQFRAQGEPAILAGIVRRVS